MLRALTLLQRSLVHRAANARVERATMAFAPGSDNPGSSRGAHASSAESVQRTISIEVLAYLVIGLLAIVTRFWDLSSRAMNHDESLHTYFSWLYFDEFHYVHDPLMHGPLLFHLTAFAYFLFGDNDYTSRIVPAFFGVLIVLMPLLLRGRNLLGRWGALIASIMLLFSPSILYYSRFIRHDVLCLFATFGVVVAALRYLDGPSRRWVVAAGTMTGLLFTTKEVSFIVAFIIVTFLLIIISWQIHRAMFGVLVGTGVLLLATYVGLGLLGAPELPGIPWQDPTQRDIQRFAFDLAVHPLVLAALGVLGLGIVAAMMVADRLRTPNGSWLDDVLGRGRPDSSTGRLHSALRDRRGLSLAVLSGGSIFVVLYTSMFTNIGGLATSTFGALGYWLGQQGVQRGEQPWFYYLLLLPQYEFIPVIVFPFAALVTLRRVVPRILRGQEVGRRLYTQGFFLYWAVLMLAVLSWAGEKMPWLSVHVVLPLILLSATYLGELVEHLEANLVGNRDLGLRSLALGGGLLAVFAGWFGVWAWGTAGPWEFNEQINNVERTLRPAIADNPWILYLPPTILLIVGFVTWRLLDRKTALAVATLATTLALLMGQMHVAHRFTYEEGDVAVDMLMYSQASPDVARVVEEVGELSRLQTGAKDLSIWYDSGTSWPFQWYLRNYDNRRFYGTELNETPDADVILIATEHVADNEEFLIGYEYQEYTMRWFFPENPTYRRFALAPELNDPNRQNYQTDDSGPYSLLDVVRSVGRSIWSLHEPEQQAQMFRLIAYRELWDQIRSDYPFRVYVRNDLVDVYDTVRYE